MTNVFISYRRSDTTSGYASWIYDRLAATHGAEHVFMDLDSLPLGVDFVEHVQRALAATDVTLVLIGPHWLGAVDALGRRRLDDPADFVRIEVAAALRSSARVIPVLVDGAEMPAAEDLPEELRPLTRRHALPFQRQGGAAINELLTAIEEMARKPDGETVGPAAAQAPVEPAAAAAPQKRRRRTPLVLGGIAVLAAGIVAAVLASGGSSSHRSTPPPVPRPGPVPKPPAPKPTPGPVLTAPQLEPVLVAKASYQALLADAYPIWSQDSNVVALHGGIPALQLCSTKIPTSGLAADTSSSYQAIAQGVQPNLYFGSDAASFTGQGAPQFVNTVAQQAPTCGWRSLPGPTLDDQVVRLTSDQQSPDGNMLHDDLILVRDGACVFEIGIATTSGLHSGQAETLADGAAQRLAQAVKAA